MDRMKTFFIYFLLFAALYIVSSLLENGLLLCIYGDITGNVYNSDDITISVLDAKATNVNGYVMLDVTNNSNEYIDNSYAKFEFINKYDLNTITEYATIKDLEPGKSKNYKVTFEANKIEKYNISMVSEIPDKSHIINVFGWELDATNLFGLGIDLTNINGVDLTQYMSFGGLKSLASTGWVWAVNIAKSVPVWGYVIASMIVLWYL